jgi:hypothetical protein
MIDQDGGNAPATQPAPPRARQMPEPPPPQIDKPNRWLPSLIWLIPLLAAIIGATQVVTWLFDKGPSITVTFVTGEGLEAGKTKVKFKEVDIGQVTKVTLGPDGNRVVATIQMAKDVLPPSIPGSGWCGRRSAPAASPASARCCRAPTSAPPPALPRKPTPASSDWTRRPLCRPA